MNTVKNEVFRPFSRSTSPIVIGSGGPPTNLMAAKGSISRPAPISRMIHATRLPGRRVTMMAPSVVKRTGPGLAEIPPGAFT